MREEDLQEIIQGENEGIFTSYKKVKNAVQGQKERARVRSVSENAHVCACARLYVSVILIDSFDVTITRGKSCHNDRNKHITHLFETHPSLLRACLCVCVSMHYREVKGKDLMGQVVLEITVIINSLSRLNVHTHTRLEGWMHCFGCRPNASLCCMYITIRCSNTTTTCNQTHQAIHSVTASQRVNNLNCLLSYHWINDVQQSRHH